MAEIHAFLVRLEVPDGTHLEDTRKNLLTCISFGKPRVQNLYALSGPADTELGTAIKVPEPTREARDNMMPERYKSFNLTDDDLNGTLVKDDSIRNCIAEFLSVPAAEVSVGVNEDGGFWDVRRMGLDGGWYVDGMTLDVYMAEEVSKDAK